MAKSSKKLSTKTFVLSQILILIIGCIFVFGLHYFLNIYNPNINPYSSNLGPVTKAPKSLRLDLDQPDDDTLTFDSSIIISGKTAPNTEVLISTNSLDYVLKSKSDGNFSTIIKLNEGVNQISAAVFDSTGDSRSQERTVFHSKEKI